MYRATHRRDAVGANKLFRSRRWPSPPAEALGRPQELRRAIEQGQLRLFYQPMVHLAGNTLFGSEVLIRWQHPHLGLLDPADFLALTDSDPDLSRDLGLWVFEQACGSAMDRPELLTVSVNAFALHFAAPDFAEQVMQVLHVTGFSPSSLVVEVTEASIAVADATMLETCAALVGAGATLALDDYGVGERDPALFTRLPVGIVKLDRSVIAGIGRSSEDEQFIASTLQAAAAANQCTIAVGVETHDQDRFLREHGATSAQGYLYGRPRPR